MNLTQFLEQREKEFGEEFTTSGAWREIKADGTLVIDPKKHARFIKSFNLQTSKMLIERFKEMVEGKIVNTPSEVAELNKDLPNTIQEQAYFQALGFEEAIKEVSSSLSKELEALSKKE